MKTFLKSLTGNSENAARDEIEQYVRILRFLVVLLMGGAAGTGLTAAAPAPESKTIPTWAVGVREDVAKVKTSIEHIKEDIREIKQEIK